MWCPTSVHLLHVAHQLTLRQRVRQRLETCGKEGKQQHA
jgi:hypothetical protein